MSVDPRVYTRRQATLPTDIPETGRRGYAVFDGRVWAAFRDLIGEARGQPWLVVSDAGPIRVILRRALDLPFGRLFDIDVPYGLPECRRTRPAPRSCCGTGPPLITAFWVALGFLTCLPVPRGLPHGGPTAGHSVVVYPLAGLVIGALCGIGAALFDGVGEGLRAAIVVTRWVAVTGWAAFRWACGLGRSLGRRPWGPGQVA